MTAQTARFEPIPDHARHLFFPLNPLVSPRAALFASTRPLTGGSP
jgi:hypothetical protein